MRKQTSQKLTIKCQFCGKVFRENIDLEEHQENQHADLMMRSEQTDEEYNCEECDFQTNNSFQLQKHKSLKHFMICKFCGKQYKTKGELMEHRKSEHPNAVARCNKYLSGICIFSSEKCWWMHTNNTEVQTNRIEFFICCQIFQNRMEVMKHRKTMHRTFVRQCKEYKIQNCRFQDESCWFLHDKESLKEVQEVTGKETENHQVFQNNQKSPKPPY